MNKNFLIKNFQTELIEDNNIYIVALSGGKDSMALINQMCYMKSIKNFDLFAIHINHNIRGNEALRDEKFVCEYCEKNNVPLQIYTVDCPSYSKKYHKTLEEAARILRYKKFEEFVNLLEKKFDKKDKVKILVAHHKKDRAETILHNIIRGSGIRGLVGIEDINDYILRPMLNINKIEIDTYIKNHNIDFVEDSTNSDINYTRNYIRNKIFPTIEKVNENYIEHICQLGNIAKEVDDYFENLSRYILEKIVFLDDEKNKTLVIHNDLFRENNHITKIYLLLHILNKIKIPKKDITKTHLDDIINMSDKNKGGHLDLPYNLTIDKKKKLLYFVVHKENYSMQNKNKGE